MSEKSMYDDWEYFRYRENMEDEDFSSYVPEILKNGFFDNQKRKSKTSKRTSASQ